MVDDEVGGDEGAAESVAVAVLAGAVDWLSVASPAAEPVAVVVGPERALVV